VRARILGDEVDRGTALGARDLTYRGAQPRKLEGRRGTNKILLAQEMMKGDELPMVVRASPVCESRRALQIVGQRERLLTERAIEMARERVAGAAGTADKGEHLQNGLGR